MRWTVKPTGDGYFAICDEASGDVITELDRHMRPESPLVHLIVAAPDLLGDCKEVLDVLDRTDAKDEVTRGAIVGSVNVLRSAIARAEGRSL